MVTNGCIIAYFALQDLLMALWRQLRQVRYLAVLQLRTSANASCLQPLLIGPGRGIIS